MNLSPYVLVVDDEQNARDGMVKILESFGYVAASASSGTEALRHIQEDRPDLVITDLRMPEMDGLELLQELKSNFPNLPVIVLTAFGTVENAVKAMHLGAYHYLIKPVNFDELKLVVQKALKQIELEQENKDLKKTLNDYVFPTPIIGKSQKMKELLMTAEKVAKTSSTVLIQGESGTGKELIAHHIHDKSERSNKPFIPFHCAAITETLLASELFGHEKGAFTGASERKVGRFERAHEGTLFLDEISEISKDAQVKLLRVLQEDEIERVGGTKIIKVDVRLISATNKNLADWVKQGNFREDLFYRLNVILLEVPPLRERQEDIPLLVEYFLKEYAESSNKPISKLAPEALKILTEYEWPGNIRELKNVIERMVVLSSGPNLSTNDLPKDLLGGGLLDADTNIKGAEKELIVQKLHRMKGNKSRAAKELGISRRTLYRKLEEYNIK